MPTLLPTAIAVAINHAHARYLANDGDPGIPFLPDTGHAVTRAGFPRARP